jgi:hypothetical protein
MVDKSCIFGNVSVVSGIFRKCDLSGCDEKQTDPTPELYETAREDMDMATDYVSPIVRQRSVGLRLKVV